MILGAEKMEDYREWWSLEPGRLAQEPLAQRICANIRLIREERGLTQAELGERVGTTKSVVSKTERGDHPPNVSKLQAYAHALGVHVAFLLLADPKTAMLVDKGHTFFFDGVRGK